MLQNQLRKARQAAGKTQQECADHLGVNFSTYSCYETGKRTPDAPKLRKIAAFLGVTGDYLLELDLKENTEKTILCESPDEIDLIRTYRTLNDAGRAAAAAAMDGLAGNPAFVQELSAETTA